MSIHLQKIIRFIPIVNTITLFFWIKMYCQKKLKISDFLKAFFTMVLVLFVVAIPQMNSDRVVSNEILKNVIFYILAYIYMFGVSFVSVADQEKHDVID